MTPRPNSKALTIGLVVAVILALICLAFALQNPAAALLPAIVFVVVAFGIIRSRQWSAYGGALFILALMAAGIKGLASMGLPAREWLVAGLGTLLFGVAAWLLFRAGRSMPAAVVRSGSRWIWIGLAAVVFLAPQVMHAYVVSAGSMENTLLMGDHILVAPVGSPLRGELVTFRYPVNPSQIFIKRIVAIGGDRVRLLNKQLIVNGTPVNEPYAVHKLSSTVAFRDNFPSDPDVPVPSVWSQELRQDTIDGALIVPAGKLFVLGDNRDNSLDSRYWGFLEPKDLLGRPVMIYFSANETIEQVTGGPLNRPPVLLHPSMIRWERMLRGL
jgi:signal peptidase I